MLNYSELVSRIEELRIKHQLNASAFADRIGVPRSSISHILSGRNKPSLEFIIKVVDAFEDTSLHELLYGETSPTQSVSKFSEAVEEISPGTPSLFDSPSKPQKNIPNTNFHTNSKNPERIIALYPDGTFETFVLKKP